MRKKCNWEAFVNMNLDVICVEGSWLLFFLFRKSQGKNECLFCLLVSFRVMQTAH